MKTLSMTAENAELIRAGRKTETRRPIMLTKSNMGSSDPGFHLIDMERAYAAGELLKVPIAHPEDGWEENPDNDTIDRVYPSYDSGEVVRITVKGKRPQLRVRILQIRPDRLQNMTWIDAVREGIKDPPRATLRTDPETGCVAQFRKLWESIYGSGSWNRDRWVWVYRFEVVKK